MSNYADRTAKYVYFAGTLDAAVWGAELAAGDGRQRIYAVEPEGEFEDDPNVTDLCGLLARWSAGPGIRLRCCRTCWRI